MGLVLYLASLSEENRIPVRPLTFTLLYYPIRAKPYYV